ncbi:MAG: PadR-like family transcriptional regulator [Haloplasmataceae bacterium]|jgi:PadR family transcriptional regulator PadR|nr:PadR-like family transcriptional regulator [Haloplasmataceae bacterium]
MCYNVIKEVMILNIQFKKGVLELCVLAILHKKNCYGYELVHDISNSFAISEGTIYPLLSRLKSEGFVTTYLEESQEGPPRKYYQLTKTGKLFYNELKQEWITFIAGVNNIIKEGELIE